MQGDGTTLTPSLQIPKVRLGVHTQHLVTEYLVCGLHKAAEGR
jgi:hypothetical protein